MKFSKLLLLTLAIPAAIATSPAHGFDASDAEPKWIWPAGDSEKKRAVFRKAFDVPEDAKRVLLLTHADDLGTLYLNGARARISFSKNWATASVWDVSDMVTRGGSNLFAIDVTNAGGEAGQRKSSIKTTPKAT